SWDIAGLKTAVHVDGTINDPRHTDRGWSVEIAFPWKVLGELAYRPAPPADGDQWRMNFSRVEWRHKIADGKYRKIAGAREDNWVWSPQGFIDMHRPETWGYVQFSTARVGAAKFQPDAAGPAKHLLHRIYYAQRQYRRDHGRFAMSLTELGIAGNGDEGLTKPPRIQICDSDFEASVEIKPAGKPGECWR